MVKKYPEFKKVYNCKYHVSANYDVEPNEPAASYVLVTKAQIKNLVSQRI
jgi:hypothetical protein